MKEVAVRAGNGLAATIGQVIFTTAITVFLILSGYAGRQGVQSLTMLTLATGLLASRQKGDVKALAYGATALIGGTALVLAFGVPPGSPLGYPLTLAVGAGSWLVVGVVLLARGKKGEPVVRRRPDCWSWIVGALSWTAISLVYADKALVTAVGKYAAYLWTPFAILTFVISGIVLPRIIARKWPLMLPATATAAGGLVKGILLGLAVSAAVAFVIAQAGPAFVKTDILSAPPCGTCDPASFVAAMQASDTANGTFIAAKFGAVPSGLLLHFAGIEAPIELHRDDATGWSASGNGREMGSETLSVGNNETTVFILLQDRELWRPLALEGLGGNRLPVEGYYAPQGRPDV